MNSIALLRQQLQDEEALGLPELTPSYTELNYLLYPDGGHYKRHLDVSRQNDGWILHGRHACDGGSLSGFSTRRVVSFLIYLNCNWDSEMDQGQLRIYSTLDSAADSGSVRESVRFEGRLARSSLRGPATDTAGSQSSPRQSVDISPEGGTLVVFYSQEVEHMVRQTRRERQCVVGWFRESREAQIPDRDCMSLRTLL